MGGADGGGNPFGCVRQIFVTADIVQQNDEFVSADPCACVHLAQTLAQSFSYGAQHMVACFMAQSVIYLFKIIKVDEQNGKTDPVSFAHGKRNGAVCP